MPLIVVSGGHKNYQNGALMDQLTDFTGGGECVGGDTGRKSANVSRMRCNDSHDTVSYIGVST